MSRETTATMTLLIENCNILARPGEEPSNVRSILIEGNRIAALSESPTQVVPAGTLRLDAYGSTVLPGMIDSHCHLFQLGSLPRSVDLRGTNSLTSIRLRLFGRVQKTSPGEWVVGRGWDQEAFVERRFPTRDDIDDVTSQNPTILIRSDEHI